MKQLYSFFGKTPEEMKEMDEESNNKMKQQLLKNKYSFVITPGQSNSESCKKWK